MQLQPVTFSGAFALAADQTLPQTPLLFNFSGSYAAFEASLFNVIAPSHVNVPFGSIVGVGAKGVLIRYDPQPSPAAPILVTFNGGDQPLEIAPGGLLVYFNPTPGAGVTEVSIEFTAACQLRVWVLG